MVTDLLWVLAGLLLLLAGAELLVRGASALALRLGITPVVVGLTVVAFGTSSPELVVSVTAALHGQPGVALGNVVGSNICNLALILGLTALIRPVAVHTRVILLDMPLMIGVSLVTWGLLADGRLGRFDGLLLTIGVVVFTGFSVRQGRREASSIQQDFGESVGGAATRLPPSILAVVGGLVVLTFGGRLLVDGAIGIARGAGVSEAVIGLTLVAVGTSLPELATSAVAALRGHSDLAVANVVGSNLFNLLGVLGPTALVAPLESVPVSATDLATMVGVALLTWPLLRTGARVSRGEGAALLGVYLLYLIYLLRCQGC